MKADQLIILTIFAFMFIQMTGTWFLIKKNNLSIRGVSPINKYIFKLGKAAMFLSWIAIIMQGSGLLNLSLFRTPKIIKILAIVILVAGWLIQLVSYWSLGANLKFGLPDKSEEDFTVLKKDRLYRFSRNPMYLGFFIIQLSIILYVMNPVIWFFSGFTVLVHHKIVLQEEVFLSKRYGEEWLEYSNSVGRYL